MFGLFEGPQLSKKKVSQVDEDIDPISYANMPGNEKL
jgi:hypothetical protein